MKRHTLSVIAALAVFTGCCGQSASPNYPTSAAPATIVIVDTDLAGAQLSVQGGDEVIAMMQGQHYTKVSVRLFTHIFSAGSGQKGEGAGTVPVDLQPGQAISLRVGGISSRPGLPPQR